MLLVFHFMSQHWVGLAAFAYLSWILHRVNELVRSQVCGRATGCRGEDAQPGFLHLCCGCAAVR